MKPLRHLLAIALFALSALPAGAQEPALPPGLGDPPKPQQPELPPGLGDPAQPDQPALPPGLGDAEQDAEDLESEAKWFERLPDGLHGFAETRIGPRLENDPVHSEDYTLAEVRLQASYERVWKGVALEARGDLIFDEVRDEVDTDLRQFRLTFRPTRSVDVQVGRLIATWGTGDLLFINDLFPKDWQAFLSGRDEDYLKAPSDAVRVGWFGDRLNVDLVYTPQFDPDRFIRGERISFEDPGGGGSRGDSMPLLTDLPDEWFDDDEIAVRVYGNVGSYEIAGYGYTGYWKSPGGFDPDTMRATFPGLDVWGASARGPLGRGIGNVEVGWYDSTEDRPGDDPLVNNSELRVLAGYELELARELTGGFQVYLERLLDYDRYLENLQAGRPRDEDRYVVTTRITKLLWEQTLIPSVFVFYSPSDGDGYLRPKLTWKHSDRWTLELGANLFFGDRPETFFGQFEDDSNLYGALRFQF